MEEEFYHKDIFGEVIDLAPTVEEDEEDYLSGSKKNNWSPFPLTDAVAEKNKREAWILYQKAIADGVDPDKEIFWRIVWVIKTLLIAKRTETYKDTDMKEYPYKKAKGNLQYWKEGELEKFSEDLVVGYHESRRGNGELESLLEKMILSL